MAIFQFSVKIIGRKNGGSAVSAAAYRSTSKLQNNRYGKEDDYTKKGWCEFSEVFLPKSAKAEYKDRSILWNSVELSEKRQDAQLAREIEISLPKELSVEQNIELAKAFVNDTFTSQGIISDVSLHNPPLRDSNGHPVNEAGELIFKTEDYVFQNPHLHILQPLRPISKNGEWEKKEQVLYVCKRSCNEKSETKSFTADEYKKAKQEGWEKQYQYYTDNSHKKKIWLTAREAYECEKKLIRVSRYPKTNVRLNPKMAQWNSKEALKNYRKSWEIHANEALRKAGRPERINCLSYKEQGADTIPGVHMGSYAARDPSSNLFQLNEAIKKINAQNREIKKELDKLDIEINEKEVSFVDTLANRFEQIRADIITTKYTLIELNEKEIVLDDNIKRIENITARLDAANENWLTRNQEAEERIIKLEKEYSNIRASPLKKRKAAHLREDIKKEKESIAFRTEHMNNMLKESGFKTFDDYKDIKDELVSLRKKRELYSQKITREQASIERNIERFGELSHYINTFSGNEKDLFNAFHGICANSERLASENIRLRSTSLSRKYFTAAISGADYAIYHSAYIVGRTASLLNKLINYADEQEKENRQQTV